MNKLLIRVISDKNIDTFLKKYKETPYSTPIEEFDLFKKKPTHKKDFHNYITENIEQFSNDTGSIYELLNTLINGYSITRDFTDIRIKFNLTLEKIKENKVMNKEESSDKAEDKSNTCPECAITRAEIDKPNKIENLLLERANNPLSITYKNVVMSLKDTVTIINCEGAESFKENIMRKDLMIKSIEVLEVRTQDLNAETLFDVHADKVRKQVEKENELGYKTGYRHIVMSYDKFPVKGIEGIEFFEVDAKDIVDIIEAFDANMYIPFKHGEDYTIYIPVSIVEASAIKINPNRQAIDSFGAYNNRYYISYAYNRNYDNMLQLQKAPVFKNTEDKFIIHRKEVEWIKDLELDNNTVVMTI